MKVAVMQPYFYPYMNYFRLIAAVDVFVLFDCVQFPRRGRVHRAPLESGGWLTLPLAKQSRDVLICDVELSESRDALWAARLAKVPQVALTGPLPQMLSPWLEARLRDACDQLKIKTPFIRSSSLGLPDDLRGKDRVMAAAKAVGGDHYCNLPGGRDLYGVDEFAAAGLGLRFLPDYPGPYFHMLEALAKEPIEALIADLKQGTRP
ncbi:MAG: WbqC family protein [Rhodobacteraceae bacterium]|nr:WbqC family protein [Paracoccaceae bacterium]